MDSGITDQKRIDATEAIIDVLAEPRTAADPAAAADRILENVIEILGMHYAFINTDHESIFRAFKAGFDVPINNAPLNVGHVVGLLMTAANGKANPAEMGKLVEEWLAEGDG